MVGKSFMIKDILSENVAEEGEASNSTLCPNKLDENSQGIGTTYQNNQTALISYANATFELFRWLVEVASNGNNNNNNSEVQCNYQTSPIPANDPVTQFQLCSFSNQGDSACWKTQRKRAGRKSQAVLTNESKVNGRKSQPGCSSAADDTLCITTSKCSKTNRDRRDSVHKQLSESLPSPSSESCSSAKKDKLPAWIFCTRYSDRPTSGYRRKRSHRKERDEKKPRTVFTNSQLEKLCNEFQSNRYLTDQRRRMLADELELHEGQIKIWFQNMRAKKKRLSGVRSDLAERLAEQGLYNHKRA